MNFSVNKWLLLTFLFVSAIAAAQSRSSESWTPEIGTLDGKLVFLQSVTSRHPQMPTANLQYRTNLVQVLNPVPELMNKLGNEAAETKINPVRIYGVTYSSNPVQYDKQKILALKNDLIDSLHKVPVDHFQNLRTDVLEIQKKAAELGGEDGTKFLDKGVKNLFRIAPFIYDSAGNTVENPLGKTLVEDRISKVSPQVLSNFYEDFIPNHLALLIPEISKQKGLGKLPALLKTSDIRKQVTDAIQPLSHSNAPVETRSLSLEEVPPLVAIMRGSTSGDCSILSVPYYALVKGAKVFWIRKTFRSETYPSGYVFTIPVEVGGKVLPYIITVNGSTLSQEDTRAAIHLAAKYYGTTEVILPDLSTNNWVVNYDSVRKGMAFKEYERVNVKFPPGWKVIEESSQFKMANYYDSGKIGSAKLVNINSEPIFELTQFEGKPFLPYTRDNDISRQPPLERAVLANSVLYDPRSNLAQQEKEQIMSKLSVTQVQVDVAAPLANARENNPLTREQFYELQKVFGFKLSGLNKLDVWTRAYTFNKLYTDAPELDTEDGWRSLAQSINKYLESGFHGAEHEPKAIIAHFSAKGQLPIKFVPEFWNRISEFIGHPEASVRKAILDAMKDKGDFPDDVWAALAGVIDEGRFNDEIADRVIDLKIFSQHSAEGWNQIAKVLKQAIISKKFGYNRPKDCASVIKAFLGSAPEQLRSHVANQVLDGIAALARSDHDQDTFRLAFSDGIYHSHKLFSDVLTKSSTRARKYFLEKMAWEKSQQLNPLFVANIEKWTREANSAPSSWVEIYQTLESLPVQMAAKIDILLAQGIEDRSEILSQVKGSRERIQTQYLKTHEPGGYASAHTELSKLAPETHVMQSAARDAYSWLAHHRFGFSNTQEAKKTFYSVVDRSAKDISVEFAVKVIGEAQNAFNGDKDQLDFLTSAYFWIVKSPLLPAFWAAAPGQLKSTMLTNMLSGRIGNPDFLTSTIATWHQTDPVYVRLMLPQIYEVLTDVPAELTFKFDTQLLGIITGDSTIFASVRESRKAILTAHMKLEKTGDQAEVCKRFAALSSNPHEWIEFDRQVFQHFKRSKFAFSNPVEVKALLRGMLDLMPTSLRADFAVRAIGAAQSEFRGDKDQIEFLNSLYQWVFRKELFSNFWKASSIELKSTMLTNILSGRLGNAELITETIKSLHDTDPQSAAAMLQDIYDILPKVPAEPAFKFDTEFLEIVNKDSSLFFSTRESRMAILVAHLKLQKTISQSTAYERFAFLSPSIGEWSEINHEAFLQIERSDFAFSNHQDILPLVENAMNHLPVGLKGEFAAKLLGAFVKKYQDGYPADKDQQAFLSILRGQIASNVDIFATVIRSLNNSDLSAFFQGELANVSKRELNESLRSWGKALPPQLWEKIYEALTRIHPQLAANFDSQVFSGIDAETAATLDGYRRTIYLRHLELDTLDGQPEAVTAFMKAHPSHDMIQKAFNLVTLRLAKVGYGFNKHQESVALAVAALNNAPPELSRPFRQFLKVETDKLQKSSYDKDRLFFCNAALEAI